MFTPASAVLSYVGIIGRALPRIPTFIVIIKFSGSHERPHISGITGIGHRTMHLNGCQNTLGILRACIQS